MQAAQMDRREWQHATVYLNWSRRLQRSKNRNKAGGFLIAVDGGYDTCTESKSPTIRSGTISYFLQVS